MTTRRSLRSLAIATLLFACSLSPASAQDVPENIAGLVAWYRADSLQLNNGEPVPVWPDASGNGHDLIDQQDGLPASFQTVQVNNLPAVLLGKGNSHAVTEPFDLGDHTIFIVLRSSLTDRALFRSESNEFAGVILRSGGVKHQIFFASGKGAAYGSQELARGGFGITVLGRESGLLRAVVDGTDFSSRAEYAGTLRVGRFFQLSQTRFAKSDGESMSIAEILIYGRWLPDPERSQVTHYLAGKYGLATEEAAPAQEGAPPSGTLAVLPVELAQLSTTTKSNVNESMVAIPWDRQDMLDPPFEHDPEGENSRLVCNRDDVRVRLHASLPLSAAVDGVNVRILFRVNGAMFLRGEGRSGSFGGPEGAGQASVHANVIATLNAGDYVEVIALRAGAAGEVRVDPDEAVFLAEVK